MKRLLIALALTAIVALVIQQAPATSAPQRMTPLNLFSALKTKVDRQGYKILAADLALADVEDHIAFNDACTSSVLDISRAVGLDTPVYALLVNPECVVAPAADEKHAADTLRKREVRP